MQRLLW